MAKKMPPTYKAAQEKRVKQQQRFLEALETHDGSTRETCLALGLALGAPVRWRRDDPEFRKQHDRIKADIKRKLKILHDAEMIFHPNRKLPAKPGFRTWRPIYTGRPVLPHQEHLVEAWYDRTNLVVICFMPPGAGKDTTAMDIVMHEGCDNRSLRQAWLMESENFSKRRVKERLSPYFTDPKVYSYTPQGPGCTKPTRSLIEDYGPYVWEPGMIYPDGSPVPRPTWNSSEMNFLANAAPEAEPNLWATGISGTLYGSRVDNLVLSDPFTRENQRNPKTRAEQLEWLEGTMESRLDEAGRLLIINTRVAPYDNQGKLLRKFTEGARVVKQSDDGFYTKWSNGTATVIIPAIQTNSEGEEVSYWEDKFPLDGQIVMPDDTRILSEDLSDEEIEYLQTRGGKRIRGLREMRRRKPNLFAAMWQQAPKSSEQGEFTDMLLNHCDDPTRTLGVPKAGEILIGGVDPARTFGASWVMWGYDPKEKTATVVDYFFGTQLGTQGIREKLLQQPVIEYLPRYMCWEINRESAVLDHPDVISVLEDTQTQLVRHTTQNNRNFGDDAIATMVQFMRDGTIRFPAATVEDRERMELFKQHFQNWDENEQSATTLRPGKTGHLADDICLAAWVGWVQIRKLMRKHNNRARRRAIPQAVLDRWGMKLKRAETRTSARLPVTGKPRKPVTDLEAAYHGVRNDDDA